LISGCGPLLGLQRAVSLRRRARSGLLRRRHRAARPGAAARSCAPTNCTRPTTPPRIALSDRPERPAVVQAAQHALFALEWLDDWPNGDRRSRLVYVVHEIPRAEILDAFAFADPLPFPSP